MGLFIKQVPSYFSHKVRHSLGMYLMSVKGKTREKILIVMENQLASDCRVRNSSSSSFSFTLGPGLSDVHIFSHLTPARE